MKFLIRIVASITVLLAGGCAHRLPEKEAPRSFRFAGDRLAYVNETVWRYRDGKPVTEEEQAGQAEGKYSRRCFVVARSALQFWKFARFEPRGKPLAEEELARRVRALARTDVWKEPLSPDKRFVFPGYANLYQLSAAHPLILQENMGAGWTIYLRPGNTPMVFPPSRGHQERTCREINHFLDKKYPAIVWMVTFPSLALNHSVLIYDRHETPDKTIFTVYDPNINRAPQKLTYDKTTRSFSYNATFYFGGGPVDLRTIYWSPGQ